MPLRQPVVFPVFGLSQIPRLCAAWFLPLRRFEASYQSTFTPTFMRGAMTYQISHSRSRMRLRWNWLSSALPPADTTDAQVIPVDPLQPTDMSTRSKCVPNRIELVVVADPVNHPFGLHRYRSWPITQFWLFFLPGVPPLSSLLWNEPIARKVYGPTLYTTPGPCAM